MSILALARFRSRAALPLRLLRAALHHGALVRSRRALLRLDDHLLRDIAVSRAEAEAEASRPVWDAPPHWREPNA